MTDSEMETIFLRFHQANRQVSSQYGGSGESPLLFSSLRKLWLIPVFEIQVWV